MQRIVWVCLLIIVLLMTFGCEQSRMPMESQRPAPTEMTNLAKKPGSTWRVPADFATIQEAIDDNNVQAGDVIRVASGNHAGAFITKRVTIRGEGQAVINDGPLHPAGLTMGFRFLEGGDGSTISQLSFNVDFGIMNGAAVNDVTVTQCNFNNNIQAVSNWCGNNWEITHNRITDLRTRSGGGIGIIVADRFGGTVAHNLISHNKINGTVYVDPEDCGGYNGSGIVLYADFRWGMAGSQALKENRVVQNKISLVSDTPDVVDVVAFELTDSRNDPDADPFPVVFDNYIGFNDFRGTRLQIAITPAELEACNAISRNLGDNRGHGLHPAVFGPGGH